MTRRTREGLFRDLLLRRLQHLRDGVLKVVDGPQERVFGEPAVDGLEATLVVRHPSFYRRAALGGSIGAGEAYRDGLWQADDLTRVIRVLARNRDALEGLDRGFGRLLRPLRRLSHLVRANSPSGSRRNIAAHYDL
ncbi:MAG: SAM-dependent methyltransferase, partial [Acidobacteria bacterium]|nr:SAM-dependent methyltransferase [Acidobacteriota bacterium]